MAGSKLILFDCDSTLSAIEGVDELARLRGSAVFARVEALTHDAMDGKVAVESVFGERLRLIRPSRSDVAAVGKQYIDTIEPTALATIAALRAAGWDIVIVSGGFRQAIRPLADLLGVARVEAVDLFFDAAGEYTGFDEDYPTTRSGGKPEIVARLQAELKPSRIVMVGDGVSDLETQSTVNDFIGFGRYITRERVKREAKAFVHSLSEIPTILS